MILLITGASHTGKTMLAQRMLEKYKYPYLSVDHLKMGLIRSGNTDLTPEDDDKLTEYLWPIVREMIKTAVENRQNLIVEGCYIPYEWRRDLSEAYLRNIRFICLAMTEDYIETHFDEIRTHGSDIESRMDDSGCTIDWIKADNRKYMEGFCRAGERIEVIDKNYEQVIERLLLRIPDSIQAHIAGKKYTSDDVGMSGSKIMIFDDSVLKIVNSQLENEEYVVQMMRWLDGKIPVSRVICYEKEDEYQYLLMSRVPGRMACDEYYLEHPKELLALLADALKMLWSVDISDCPRSRNIDVELEEAKRRVENNMVDLDNVEQTTFGEGGFENPQALLKWLEDNRPDYEPVLSHGDFCLPNIFIADGQISGFIDLGDTGTGDKWRDIALCYRSLKHNFDGSFGGKVYPDFNPDRLFEALGIEPNWEKLKFYMLLDELF